MLKNWKKGLSALCLMAAVVGASAMPALADMAAGDITAVQTGITGALSTFFVIGGTILTVVASIWGFKQIKGLFGR